MSLLLKALKQAETAHAAKPPMPGSELELEDGPLPSSASAREWVDTPGGHAGSAAPAARHWQLPHLSLVPATALVAALVALGYGAYLYFALQPPALPAVATPVAAPMPAPLPESASLAPLPMPAAPRAAAVVPDAIRPLASARHSPRRTAPAPVFRADSGASALNLAYAAYQNGQLNDALRLYTQAAARERSVDALLGLAAVAAAQNRDDEAQRLYREILDRDPRNAAAQAALLDLLGNTDKQAAESRLKALIEREPGANLYQTLGNLYADQNRWVEAQAAYFEAYRAAPANADYAFNLAVSLERLHQGQAALPYYEKALSLAGSNPGGASRFDRALAEARVRQLKAP